MPVKKYDGTNWITVAGDGAAGAPGADGTNGLDASPFAAGKNKIINGDFRFNQRGFTSTTTTATYGLDRWQLDYSDGTSTYSVQTFTPGAAPVAGYEAINFARIITTGQTLTTANTRLVQSIEDVRTFAGQTVTVSFWAKAATGTPKIAVELAQGMGAGGSGGANNTIGNVTISTSWTRYSVTGSVAGLSGATIGTSSALVARLFVSAGSAFNARTGSMGIQSNTFDIWGVQAEAGSVATAFQTASGTIQGELALCQRYYARLINGADQSAEAGGISTAYSTSQTVGFLQFPVPMRVSPTITVSSVSDFNIRNAGFNGYVSNAMAGAEISPRRTRLNMGIASTQFTAGQALYWSSNTSTSFIDASAEL